MAEPKHIPRNAVVVERFQELNSFTQAFAAGHLRFLMVVGPAGTGKSRAMRSAVDGRAAWVDGNATAFGVYCTAFMHQDQPIVLDDVDALYRDSNGIRLLKQLCQSEPSRLLGWYSDPQYLKRRGIPPKFKTSGPVAIIANRWSTMNADVAALEDRGHMIVFDPSPIEIHQQAALWFHDKEVFEFISKYLHLITNHSFRTYVLAFELKKARMNWKRTILSRFLSGPASWSRSSRPTPRLGRKQNECKHSEKEEAETGRPISVTPKSFIRRPCCRNHDAFPVEELKREE